MHNIYIHTYIHTNIHTYIHIYIHTRTDTYIHTSVTYIQYMYTRTCFISTGVDLNISCDDPSASASGVLLITLLASLLTDGKSAGLHNKLNTTTTSTNTTTINFHNYCTLALSKTANSCRKRVHPRKVD